MNGAELIAEFVSRKCASRVFLVTGGACAFIVDAIGRHESLDYVAFQHEQAAAMAADAIWRTTGRIGVTVATSGPGATNLITGIACSWFDSIPTLHITGQVNERESAKTLGVAVRQAGFQETDISEMCRTITKLSIKVTSTAQLADALVEGFKLATSGRMGPVLIDVPMDVQQSECSTDEVDRCLSDFEKVGPLSIREHEQILVVKYLEDLFGRAERPLVVFGAGLGLSGTSHAAQKWCDINQVPYCASWGGMPFIDRSSEFFIGSLGVYGSRLANWAVQSADEILVLGSRLDNRQRTGNPNGFAPFANLTVFDIDSEELKKFETRSNYVTACVDLGVMEGILDKIQVSSDLSGWRNQILGARHGVGSGFSSSVEEGLLNPYLVTQKIQSLMAEDAIVVSDCGANLCWVYQAFMPGNQTLFTAGGNSPMGYALPAAIGAKLASPDKQTYCFIGDGGFQMNIQELQTIAHYDLDIKIVVFNNEGYGIIKQFQDTYMESRYEASGRGYSVPDFKKVAEAYGLSYKSVQSLDDLDSGLWDQGAVVVDVAIPPNALITPKVEMDRFIHDQFPYDDRDHNLSPLFGYPARPSML
jgi:acetolactate synthase-1/2/3 large subunit